MPRKKQFCSQPCVARVSLRKAGLLPEPIRIIGGTPVCIKKHQVRIFRLPAPVHGVLLLVFTQSCPMCITVWPKLFNPRRHVGGWTSGVERRGFSIDMTGMHQENSDALGGGLVVVRNHRSRKRSPLYVFHWWRDAFAPCVRDGCVASQIRFVVLWRRCRGPGSNCSHDQPLFSPHRLHACRLQTGVERKSGYVQVLQPSVVFGRREFTRASRGDRAHVQFPYPSGAVFAPVRRRPAAGGCIGWGIVGWGIVGTATVSRAVHVCYWVLGRPPHQPPPRLRRSHRSQRRPPPGRLIPRPQPHQARRWPRRRRSRCKMHSMRPPAVGPANLLPPEQIITEDRYTRIQLASTFVLRRPGFWLP
eukprot:gene25280-biopygen15017